MSTTCRAWLPILWGHETVDKHRSEHILSPIASAAGPQRERCSNRIGQRRSAVEFRRQWHLASRGRCWQPAGQPGPTSVSNVPGSIPPASKRPSSVAVASEFERRRRQRGRSAETAGLVRSTANARAGAGRGGAWSPMVRRRQEPRSPPHSERPRRRRSSLRSRSPPVGPEFCPACSRVGGFCPSLAALRLQEHATPIARPVRIPWRRRSEFSLRCGLRVKGSAKSMLAAMAPSAPGARKSNKFEGLRPTFGLV